MRLQRYGFFFVTRYLSVEKTPNLTIFYHFLAFSFAFSCSSVKKCAFPFCIFEIFFSHSSTRQQDFFVTLQRLHMRFRKRLCRHMFFILRFFNLKYNLIKK